MFLAPSGTVAATTQRNETSLAHTTLVLALTNCSSCCSCCHYSYILSPNKIHNMSMPQWKEKFPEARMYASPGLVERRQDLKFDATLKVCGGVSVRESVYVCARLERKGTVHHT